MEMLIDNTRVGSDNRFEVIYPYTQEPVDTVPVASMRDINHAIELSHATKCELSGIERASILKKSSETIQEQRDEIAELITKESGLCIKHTLHEVQRAITCLNYAAIQAESIDQIDLTAEFITHSPPSAPKLTVVAEPWDLVLAITPFNHPLNLVVHKVAPAIAAGTPMVLKPSEKTPLTALKFGEILVKNGLPPNMLNIVTGIPPKDIVDPLVTHPKIDLVTFTGGVETGKYIARKMVNSGNVLKRYMPELGGNATFVVMNDCDIELAARIALAAFDNSGQRCTAIRRIFLHNSVAEGFLDRFCELTSQIEYGDPMDPDTDMGTVITPEQAELIQLRVDKAVNSGSNVLIGNQREGALYSPTIVDNVDPHSDLAANETFGPVVSIIRVTCLEEARDMISADRFGLASAIATSDRDTAMSLHETILTGQFNWNGPPGYRTEAAPFGGFRDSGNGEKEGVIMMTRAMRRIRTFYEHRSHPEPLNP
jgi:aldehyde dehydrogenase (NAD+)